MKTAAIPTIGVTPELRRDVEELLDDGESLSAFVEDAIRRNVEFRRAPRAFVARCLVSGAEARQPGSSVSASRMVERLDAALKPTCPS